MKFNCGPTSEEKFNNKHQWHKWFAWHPVRVGPRDCRWLEFVWRRGTYYCDGWDWDYK